tara:strand:+ start:230 stop:613 length:384 start_codon:yes stop_codon:yes gene_type:complete
MSNYRYKPDVLPDWEDWFEPMGECPSCDSPDLKRRWMDHTFPFYVRPSSEEVEVTAYIPVESCINCGDNFTDFRSECIKEEAVKEMLGLPTDRTLEWALHIIGIDDMDVTTTGMRRDSFAVHVFRRL